MIFYLIVCTGSAINRTCTPAQIMPSKHVCEFVAEAYVDLGGHHYTDATCLTIRVPAPKRAAREQRS